MADNHGGECGSSWACRDAAPLHEQLCNLHQRRRVGTAVVAVAGAQQLLHRDAVNCRGAVGNKAPGG